MTGPETISAAEYRALVAGDRSDRTGSGKKRTGPTKAFKQFEQFLEHGGFGPVIREHKFHKIRRWRFDFYLPEQGENGRGIAFEYQGLMRHGENQGHASIGGIMADIEKQNAATAMGIPVYMIHAKSIGDGSAFELADRVLRKQEG